MLIELLLIILSGAFASASCRHPLRLGDDDRGAGHCSVRAIGGPIAGVGMMWQIRIAGAAVASGAGGVKWRVMLDPSCAVPFPLVANCSQLLVGDRDGRKSGFS